MKKYFVPLQQKKMSKGRISVEVELSTIKSQLRKDEKFSQGIRLYAVYQIKLGRKAEDLECLYNVSHKSICNWVHSYNLYGIKGLKDKPRSGRPPRLNDEQQRKVKEVVMDKPEKFGYASGVWSGPLVIDYIQNTFGISYKKAQIYNLLRGLGLTFQRSKAFYPEASEREEIVTAIKKTLRKK
jgi:transposase